MGLENPFVSISCITYNHASFIKKTIDGFLSQKTSFSFEILIHDDCSTDGTTEIIKDYAKKYPDIIFPIFEEVNQFSLGVPSGSAIWNLPRARGKYIALCEGDDYWTDPYKLQIQVDFLESHPDYGMCYTKVKRLDQKSGKVIDEWGGTYTSFEELLKKNTIPTLTTVFRRELYIDYLNDVQPSIQDWKMGDYPLWLYFALKSKIKFINTITGVYRVLEDSASHSKNIEKSLVFLQSFHDIRTWFNDKYKGIEQKALEQNQSILLFNSAVVHKSQIHIIDAYKKITKKNLKIRVKYTLSRLCMFPLIDFIYRHKLK